MESLHSGSKAYSEARGPQGETIGTESITESESDDLFYDNDNVSVISDSLSISSKTLRKYDTKKIAQSLHRLKQGNLALRDSLEKMNTTDVVILKAKLRAANADLVRMKQVNAELRDLNQVLEKRLASLLAEFSQSREKSVTVRLSRALAQQRQQQSMPLPEGGQIEAKAPDVGSGGEIGCKADEELQLLQRRLKHAERLLQSYEVKLNLLQGGDNGVARESAAALLEGETADTASPITSAAPAAGSGSSVSFAQLPQPRRRKVYTEEDLRRRLEESREVDKRTIQELLQEVKRLEAQTQAQVQAPPLAAPLPPAPPQRVEETGLPPKPAAASPSSWSASLVMVVSVSLAVVLVLLQTAHRLYRLWHPTTS